MESNQKEESQNMIRSPVRQDSHHNNNNDHDYHDLDLYILFIDLFLFVNEPMFVCQGCK